MRANEPENDRNCHMRHTLWENFENGGSLEVQFHGRHQHGNGRMRQSRTATGSPLLLTLLLTSKQAPIHLLPPTTTMSSFATATFLLNTLPVTKSPSNQHEHDHEANGLGFRRDSPSDRSRKSLFKSLSKKDTAVHVLCPENIAVQYIDSKASILNPKERRRIARREQRRDRSGSVSSVSSQEEE